MTTDAVDRLPRFSTFCLDRGAAGVAKACGYSYVLEESAMGASVLRERVRSELPGAPVSFLAAADRSRWRPLFDAFKFLSGSVPVA